MDPIDVVPPRELVGMAAGLLAAVTLAMWIADVFCRAPDAVRRPAVLGFVVALAAFGLRAVGLYDNPVFAAFPAVLTAMGMFLAGCLFIGMRLAHPFPYQKTS